jgi:alanine racemase
LQQTGKNLHELYAEINHLIGQKGIHKLIGIGPEMLAHKHLFEQSARFYLSTAEFLDDYKPHQFSKQAILIKGARKFQFERITNVLQKKVHETRLEVNLSNMVKNLKIYQSRLHSSTRIMVMVKAFSYGSGSFEIANALQYHQVDYLAVAYADEGIALREAGIHLPIMVMNPSKDSYRRILAYQLEPEIYSLKSLQDLLAHCASMQKNAVKIHLKLDTGMHRLGFCQNDIDDLLRLIQDNPCLQIASVFSHLASAEDENDRDFSLSQIHDFNQMCRLLEERLQTTFLKHILNSAGVINYPEAQMDMVRLGIGLYGIDSADKIKDQLHNVTSFKTTISQLKKLEQGSRVGYNRKGIVEEDALVATIGVGYADGFPRLMGNGRGQVKIKNQLCPIIGNVCMDMCMVDVSGLQLEAGEEVILFDQDLRVEKMAEICHTISYEILAGISQRVKRVYFNE